MDSLPQIPGIYMIVCRYSHKIYIGSSNNVLRRWKEHRKKLRNNTHENSHLMAAWNKYGECSFRCVFIESVNQDELINKERFWLDSIKPFGDNGYNICENPMEPPMKGKRHTEDAIKKIGLSSKGRKGGMTGKNQSESARQKLRDCNLGKKVSDETKQKMSKSNKGRTVSDKEREQRRIRMMGNKNADNKKYIVTHPDGTEELVNDMKAFCADHRLKRCSMYNVAANRASQVHGYKCRHA